MKELHCPLLGISLTLPNIVTCAYVIREYVDPLDRYEIQILLHLSERRSPRIIASEWANSLHYCTCKIRAAAAIKASISLAETAAERSSETLSDVFGGILGVEFGKTNPHHCRSTSLTRDPFCF